LKNTHPVDPQDNRRKAKRRPILDTFSLFVVVSTKNILKLKINDLSELGIGFNFDIEGEADQTPVKNGDIVDLQLYLNQSLHIPLQIKVVRIEDADKMRKIGAEYTDKKSTGYQALMGFLEMLDRLADAAQIDAPGQSPAASPQ
jgi:hypothetical protein